MASHGTLIRFLAALVIILAANVARAGPQPEKFNLTVLYAGEEGQQRTRNFVNFLEKYFTGVRTAGVQDLSMEIASGADVVIVDSTTPYKGSGFKMPKVARLGKDFTKPTILMGAAGGAVLQQYQLKLNWL